MPERPERIMYIGGGVMAGLFSAGVLTSFLKDEKIHDKFDAIYASSAGTFCGAHFLTNQPENSSVFYDDLTHDFIITKNVLPGVYDRFINRFFRELPVNKIRNVIDIDYVIKILTTSKKLDLNKLTSQHIPLYLHIFDTEEMKLSFQDMAHDSEPLEVIKLAVTAVPYVFPRNMRYIDGAIESSFPYSELRKRHPNAEIVAVINILPLKFIRRFIKGCLEASVTALIYPLKICKLYISRDYISRKELKLSREDKKVFMITPPRGLKIWPNTVNKNKLLDIYKVGQDIGAEFWYKHLK